jgi:hypothetical protein
MSSPLRVERARAMMLVPVAYDLMTETLATQTASVDLAPSARELDIELGWSAALSPTSSLRLASPARSTPGTSRAPPIPQGS